MKIQCSFCTKEKASVFCTADEAPLCDNCDRQVHHVNKLAGKHKRFSLLHHDFPSCDICQDNRAILFCKEDRAILCRDCDVSIHKVNEHTRKHYRFLLSGVMLSASASEYQSSSSSSSSSTSIVESDSKSSKPSTKRPTSLSPHIISSHPAKPAETKPSKPSTKRPTSVSPTEKIALPTDSSYKSTDHANQSISEYLMETLPGWRVDDFLDPCSAFAEFPDHGVGTHLSSLPYDDLAGWVPQDTPHLDHLPLYISQTGVGNGLKTSEESNAVMKVSRKRIDDGFTVPEISTQALKKSRNLW